MRILHVAASASILLMLIMQASSPAFAAPAYARAGAFASYTAEGGFIPYFSGVEGNITYTVVSVLGNGSMHLRIFENITAGTDLNPFVANLNITDSVSNPVNFPASPLAALGSGHIRFQNVSADILQNNTASVPAGTFQTMEFSGPGENGTSVHFWFDRMTGLMVEESSGTSVMELDSSNIAVPSGPPAGFNGEVAYELVFVFAFAIGGGAFLFLRHHYTSLAQAKKEASKKK